MKPLLFIGIVLYYAMLTLLFSTTLGTPLTGFTGQHDLTSINQTVTQPTIEDGGGFFESFGDFFTGVGTFLSNAFKLFSLVLFGVGMPIGTPVWFEFPFIVMQIVIFIIFIISWF